MKWVSKISVRDKFLNKRYKIKKIYILSKVIKKEQNGYSTDKRMKKLHLVIKYDNFEHEMYVYCFILLFLFIYTIYIKG